MPELHLEPTYEKQLAAEVSNLVWSPKMDLVAFSLATGGVALYRMTLHRVWSTEPPEEGVSVSALCWRPDGRLLAVGYTSDADVDALDEDDFLPPLSSLSNKYGSVNKHSEEDPQDVQGIADLKTLTVLAVGTRHGQVSLLLHGLLVFCRHDCGAGLEPRVMTFSNDLSRLLVLCGEQTETTKEDTTAQTSTDVGSARLMELDLSVMSGCSEQLRQLATLYGRISSHLVYLDRTIQAICEAWETVLLEMDSKMERFQASLGEDTSLSVEFLELLMFGVPSPEMERFLLTDLTDTGLKKLRHSIELSYTNIQSLVLRHLQPAAFRIADYLLQVAGMVRHKERFGHLGLSEERVVLAQQAVTLFLVKATDIQQVIDSSTRNFVAFFRWLYAVILRLAETSLPPDVGKISQQELSFIAEFVDTNLGDSATARGVHLERVGMYLRNADLEAPPTLGGSQWRRLLSESASLAAAPGIVPPTNGSRSLIQEHDALRRAVAHLFADNADAGARTVRVVPASSLSGQVGPLVAVSALPEGSPGRFLVVLADEQPARLHVAALGSGTAVQVDLHTLLTELGLSPPAGAAPRLCQLCFFSSSVLSALVTDVGAPVYLQLDVAAIAAGSPAVSCSAGRALDNMAPVAMAVSGARSLVAVLFQGGRRARVYDTADGEPEDSVLETTHGSADHNIDDNKENLL
ncbi:Anaphase-promoting complex subunit 4 [Amphibalanus amphitrite]|uniref:Anaphase-promoting complex subunit 4 n=1 Tax=Amphibalanus amphitrite TaxID=1232801 RepID=A0A6A4WNZ0_AMPAM|nr:Anaphase-promoting complex subunit 4 [Amphibalanus amphitrite]